MPEGAIWAIFGKGGHLSRITGRGVLTELLIVVFGILIALGVDRWNERRQARATESAYMEALARDLESDTAALGTLVRMYRNRRDAAQRVFEALQSPASYEGDPGGLSWDVNSAGWVTSFDPTDFTYRELVATGGLALIRDAELKRDVIAYYQEVDFIAQFYSLWHGTATNRYNPEVRRRVSTADWAAIKRSRGTPDDVPVNPGVVLGVLAVDGQIEKLLVSMIEAADQLITTHEALRARSADLLNALSGRT